MKRRKTDLRIAWISTLAVGFVVSMSVSTSEASLPRNYLGAKPATGRIPGQETEAGGEVAPRPGDAPRLPPDRGRSGSEATPGASPGGSVVRSPGSGAPGGLAAPGRRPRKSAPAGPGGVDWSTWWGYNRDEFLRAKRHLASGRTTGFTDWLLGEHEGSSGVSVRPVGPRETRDRVIPALVAGLHEESVAVRAASVLALGKTGHPSAFEPLVDALSDHGPRVADSAVLALGLLGDPRAAEVLGDLARDTRDGRRYVRRASGVLPVTRGSAAIALGLLRGDAARETLLELLRDDVARLDVDVAVGALIGLGLFGDAAGESAHERVARVLDNGRVRDIVRVHAASTLARVPGADRTTRLRRLARDPSREVRRAAVLAMGVAADVDDAATLRRLEMTLTKGDDALASDWAGIALGRIGGERSRRVLRDAVTRDRDPFAALALALAVRKDGSLGDEDAGLLREGLVRARSPLDRGGFAVALGLVSDVRARAEIRRMAATPGDPLGRGGAILGLALLEDGESAPLLRDLVVTSADPVVQFAATVALGALGDREAVDPLLSFLRTDRSSSVKRYAAFALGQIGDHRALDGLLVMLGDKSEMSAVRADAATSLGVLVHGSELSPLAAVARDLDYTAMVDVLRFVTDLL